MLCMSFLTHLECPECERDCPADVVQNLCHCGAPLFARYDLERVAAALVKLKERELVGAEERIVLFNTGSGLKYTHLLVNE
jgi:threonine synthase